MLFRSSGPDSINFRYGFTTFSGGDSGYAKYKAFLLGFLLFRVAKTDKCTAQNKAKLDAFGSLASEIINFRDSQRFQKAIPGMQNTKFPYGVSRFFELRKRTKMRCTEQSEI